MKNMLRHAPADLLGLAGACALGRCGYGLLRHGRTPEAFGLLAILALWLLFWSYVHIKQTHR